MRPIEIINLDVDSSEICDTLPGLNNFSQGAETFTYIDIFMDILNSKDFDLHDLHN